MDKMSQNLFSILYEFNSTENYRVVTFDDIRTKWDGMTNIEQLLDELIEAEYIEVKYRDTANICYICLKKPASSQKLVATQPDSVVVETKTTTKNLLLPALVSFASGFLGAFLAVIIGILILL